MSRYMRKVILAVIALSAYDAMADTSLKTAAGCGTAAVDARLAKSVNDADFKTLKFRLVDAHLQEIATTVTPIDLGGGVFAGAHLVPASGSVDETDFVEVTDLNANVLDIKQMTLASGTITFSPSRRSIIDVTFPCAAMGPLTVKRNDTLVNGVNGALNARGRAATLHLPNLLRNKDKIVVEADAVGGGTARAEATVKFDKPSDIDSAVFYASGKLEADQGTKPKVLVDFKLDQRLFPVQHSIAWTHGPTVLVNASTHDSDGEGTATLSYGVRRFADQTTPGPDHLLGTEDDRIIVTQLDAAPTLEFDDGLNTRNAIADMRYQWQFPGTAWDLRPAIGFEGGRNLSIKTKLASFDHYHIARPRFELNLARKWKPTRAFLDIEKVTLSLDTQTRYLIDGEPDTVPLPRSQRTADSKTTTRLFRHGVKSYGKLSLSFDFPGNIGIAFQYERGERPPLYGDNKKGSAAVVIAF